MNNPECGICVEEAKELVYHKPCYIQDIRSYKRRSTGIQIVQKELEKVVKYLDLTLDTMLSFKSHIEKINNKATCSMGHEKYGRHAWT